MARVKDINFLNLEGWMVSRLHLKGDALIAYGIIFTHSQGDKGMYTGGLGYIAEWAGCHPDTARRALRSLTETGLIIEHRGDVNGVPFCHYTASEEALQSAGVSLQISGVSPQNASTPSPQNSGVVPANCGGKTINRNTSKRTASINTFDFCQALIDLGVSVEVADAWMQVRKAARASNTEVAFKGVAREIAKSGLPADDCIRTAVERSWRGFSADWLKPHEAAQAPRPERRYISPEERTLNALARLQSRDGMLHTLTPEDQ